MHIPQFDDIKEEVEFSTARSSGPGGQNVNKVNSKVVLRWNVVHSTLLTEEVKSILKTQLKSKLTSTGDLIVAVQESRSQRENKELAIVKLNHLLKRSLTPKKKRKPTKPTKASKVKRQKEKKLKSEKKQWRQKPQ
ncbi:MAG TPA: alternative ribosome rescue aminoacyl-tRNA hydrolase ArfB [Cyclobacteriaceae bacterium]|nr:alternative ribosome rescue aminoacyl-tRNA hydrolase ArfB [Cyclobacteriaceae bacterium]